MPGDVLVGMHIWETATLDNVAYILKRPDFADAQPGEVLHPPRRRDALRLSAGCRRQDGAAVNGLIWFLPPAHWVIYTS